MIIKHEKDVEYLFARFHHLLGFEKVLVFQEWFPDVTAVRNGVEVKIELEYILSRINHHYYVHGTSNPGGFEKKDGRWYRIVAHSDLSQLLLNYPEPGKIKRYKGYEKIAYPDQEDNLYLSAGQLRRKSLKPIIDVIVCWEIDHYPLTLREDPDRQEIDVIELKSTLDELGVSW